MSQRGEATLFCVLALLALTSLMTLSSLQLLKSYKLMQKRTELFLCTKEAKGELGDYLRTMGQTNWGIKNLKRLSLIAAFIPGLQGVAANSEKARRLLMNIQDLRLISYLNSLRQLKSKACPLDPRMVSTPYATSGIGHQRDGEGAAKLRSRQCRYHFIAYPYALSLEGDLSSLESPMPRLKWRVEEKLGEIIIPFALTIIAGSVLIGSMFWLNTYFEKKTKEHLLDFKNRWEVLARKYPE